MNDVITVEDCILTETGRRFLHLMSNAAIVYSLPEGVKAEATVEAGVHHLRVHMPVRGPVDFRCEGWPRPRRLVMWSLLEGERMSEIILRAAEQFQGLFGGAPMFAFVRSLPSGIEPGRVIPFGDDEILLFNAEWMFGRSVAVGGREFLPVAVR